MGKFDNQLAHWREQHRVAVEDLEDSSQARRRWRKTMGQADSAKDMQLINVSVV
jgi:hypothetical protein